ncbi:amidohydrolase [Marinobacterium jannaschii]|uniref:amidohydrolase n=1 Tax=Marinobacterium jannaschii TaxID=64970 RepID=UPI000A06FA43|nr:amidohydrolase [Marinobacterium jannaschii]
MTTYRGMLAGWLLALGMATGLQAAPDLVLYNGQIVTVDKRFTRVQALAVEKGVIVASGQDKAVRYLADKNTRQIDLQGRTVIPGLIDNHMHLIRGARNWRQQLRLDGVTRYQHALELIAAKAAASQPGDWVLVLGGFVERQFTDQPDGFSRADLDRAAPDNPVYIQHLFDWGYANSAALAEIGIDAAVAWQKRPGLLLDDSGLPSGPVTKGTRQALLDALPTPEGKAAMADARAMVDALLRLGLTTVQDAGGFDLLPGAYTPFALLDSQEELNLRLYYLKQLIPWEKGFGYPPDMTRLDGYQPRQGSDFYSSVGVGEQLYLKVQDSASRPADSSPEVRARFLDYCRILAKRGITLHLHAVHDRSINQHLDAFATLAREYDLRALRWTLAHADGIKPETIRRAKALGINIAVHSRPWLIGYRFHSRFGERAFEMTPMRSLSESGIAWGLGSDSPMVSSLNPFHTLSWAVNGTMVDGNRISRQTVTRQQALVAHTINNARLLFAEQQLGSLEPGKQADLLVLDRDYLAIPAEEIAQIRVLATMLNGRWVYRAEGY